MNIALNKGKSIGKVLYIVEGEKTEPYILHKLFTEIFDYQFETIIRNKKYRKYNSKENVTSQVFVINAEESNIKYIAKDNKFLDNLFGELIENYDFDIDNFGECNMEIFNYEENTFATEQVYRALSLICISLIDLGLIEIESRL